MSNKLTGKISADVTGFGRIRNEPGATLNFGGRPKEGVSSDLGAVGYREGEFQYPSITITVIHGADTDVEAMREATGLTITHTTDSGQVRALQQAWTSNVLELPSGGSLQVTFQGMRVDRVK